MAPKAKKRKTDWSNVIAGTVLALVMGLLVISTYLDAVPEGNDDDSGGPSINWGGRH